jgi:hypothetical protein
MCTVTNDRPSIQPRRISHLPEAPFWTAEDQQRLDAAQRQASAIRAEVESAVNDGKCFNCDLETDGNVIAGQHVQLCDRCLCTSVVDIVGKALAAEVIAAPAPVKFSRIDVYDGDWFNSDFAG